MGLACAPLPGRLGNQPRVPPRGGPCRCAVVVALMLGGLPHCQASRARASCPVPAFEGPAGRDRLAEAAFARVRRRFLAWRRFVFGPLAVLSAVSPGLLVWRERVVLHPDMLGRYLFVRCGRLARLASQRRPVLRSALTPWPHSTHSATSFGAVGGEHLGLALCGTPLALSPVGLVRGGLSVFAEPAFAAWRCYQVAAHAEPRKLACPECAPGVRSPSARPECVLGVRASSASRACVPGEYVPSVPWLCATFGPASQQSASTLGWPQCDSRPTQIDSEPTTDEPHPNRPVTDRRSTPNRPQIDTRATSKRPQIDQIHELKRSHGLRMHGFWRSHGLWRSHRLRQSHRRQRPHGRRQPHGRW